MHLAPLNTAVLFIVFNRPDTTGQVFEAIRQARPLVLYVAADGPRAACEGEAERVAKVRDIATKVDWPCELKTLFRENNLGCKYAVSSAINWFFEHEKQGIILEDDCLPSQSFFGFSELMLDRYRDHPVVMHIGGHKPDYVSSDQFDITFTRATNVWGWATWADRWKKYLVDLQLSNYDLNLLCDYEYFGSRRSILSRVEILKNLIAGKIDTWDYQWNCAVRMNSGLGIRPSVNLVKNIGLGHQDAVHTTRYQQPAEAYELDLHNLSVPPWILPNRKLEKQFENSQKKGQISRLINRVFK